LNAALLGRRQWLALVAAAAVPGCATLPPQATLNADDRVAIAQITQYLNALHSFKADFAQTGPDGVSQGTVWMQRPGQLCVLYERPRRKIMLANQGRLRLADLTTGATTSLPLARTPLDILLAPVVQLTDSITITGIVRQPGALQLSLVKTASPGQGTLTLRFSAAPLALTGVTIVDRNGQTTAFDLSDMQRDVQIDPARFSYTPS
jgi:outer membrane lipoprotein-sorting protein